jgi:hypothetical protein
MLTLAEAIMTLADVSKTMTGAHPSPVVRPITLARGALVSRDLDLTQRYFEDLLGFECVRLSPDHMLARHRNAGEDAYWALSVRKVETIAHPQNILNHWGVALRSRADVDRAYEIVAAQSDIYGIRRVQKPRGNHGSYSFLMEDADTNWWEIEARPPERAYALDVGGGDR